MVLSLMLITVSCTKSTEQRSQEPVTLDIEFGVAEQENVSHYVIETSVNGVTYSDAGVVFATTNMEEVYQTTIDATNLFSQSKTVFTRIKSVDIDGKIDYSEIRRTTKQ